MSDSDDSVSRDVTDSTKKIELLQYHAPPLRDGKYQIDATQEVKRTSPDETLDSFTSQYEIVVSGLQFRLPDNAVHSVYPPNGSTGLYDGHLPHVVLNKTTLPWQRAPGAASASPAKEEAASQPSWLALLLFDGPGGIPETQQGTVNDVVNSPDNVFFPPDVTVGPSHDPSDPCSFIDVGADLFNRIAPSRADLPYLAHVRQTDATEQALDHRAARTAVTPLAPQTAGEGAPGDSVATGTSGDPSTNERAVVVGTRLPRAALERPNVPKKRKTRHVSTQNTVHLVSLEGYGPHLPADDGSSNLPGGTTTVRLVTLHQWTFNAAKHEYKLWKVLHNTPSEASRHQVQNPNTKEVETQKADDYTDVSPPFLHLPSDALSNDLPAHAESAVRAGFTPMTYHTRTGDEVAAWYRGPLSPVERTESLPKTDAIDHADQLMHFDEDTGMFDVSYAAAYQLGRLLALQDGHAAEAIARWRKAKVRRTRRALTRMQLLGTHPPRPDADPDDGVDAAAFQQTVADSLADALSTFIDQLE